ncbi:hypothetical protein ABID08_002534 [Rhizobium binae]|uniref:Transposase n=1 Tax=Rhizobium binae TaxID=1138190 RepID=A0ABV2MFC8_9HYPH
MRGRCQAEGAVSYRGVFHTGNMDVTLDREFLRKGTVDKFPNRPVIRLKS